jgi:hypothetical protein
MKFEGKFEHHHQYQNLSFGISQELLCFKRWLDD